MTRTATEFFVGLDVGQSNDYSALAVVERPMAGRQGVVLGLRHLERIPLRTPYPEVVERTREVMAARALAGRGVLVVDATGVGRPIVDLLRGCGLRCRLWPVRITCGRRVTLKDGYYGVPKRDLVMAFEALMESGRLQIAAKLEHARTLVREMAAMRVRQTAAGYERFGAWRAGEHDDLVLAAALGCWGAEQGRECPCRANVACPKSIRRCGGS